MEMKCEDIKGRLPEYLAGTLDKSSRELVEEHLKECETCSREASELNENVTPGLQMISEIDQKRIIKKTKVKFNLAIARMVGFIACCIILIYAIPVLLLSIHSAIGQDKASRALMDAIQFSQPNKVNWWGNSYQGFPPSESLKIGARPVVGHKYREQLEFTGKKSFITGKVTVPAIIGANFVHPDQFNGVVFRSEQDIKVQTGILKKNADNSVATVDYSLNGMIALSDVEDLIGKYDVEICWMAVEAGIEDFKPKNMTFENQQALQWGIPGKLSRPGSFDIADLKRDKGSEFEKMILEEMEWLDRNKGILKPDSSLLNTNGIDSSVKDKASYIVKNGIKIYGLRITGPSSEIIKLTGELDARTMTVIDMDFWNW